MHLPRENSTFPPTPQRPMLGKCKKGLRRRSLPAWKNGATGKEVLCLHPSVWPERAPAVLSHHGSSHVPNKHLPQEGLNHHYASIPTFFPLNTETFFLPIPHTHLHGGIAHPSGLIVYTLALCTAKAGHSLGLEYR